MLQSTAVWHGIVHTVWTILHGVHAFSTCILHTACGKHVLCAQKDLKERRARALAAAPRLPQGVSPTELQAALLRRGSGTSAE